MTPVHQISRRLFLISAAAGLSAPASAQGLGSHKVIRDWRPHFETLENGAILCDTFSRNLHFWSADGGTYRRYPTSVPQTEDLTRRGRTEVVRKVAGPSWAPTPQMKARNPDLPDFIGPGADNPLGSHALYLGWEYYRIHGTQDSRKIGRRSSQGCIGLYNEDIAELFGLATVGTQVLLISQHGGGGTFVP